MSRLAAHRFALPLAAGALFGGAMQVGGRAHVPGWWAFHLGAPWLACAFAAGVLVAGCPGGRRRRGAEAGAALMLAAVLAYYAVSVGRGGLVAAPYGTAMSAAWTGVGVPLAALFGAAGAVARAGAGRWRAACIALLGGTLCGEALLLLATRGHDPVFVLELAAGAACPLLTLLPSAGVRGGERTGGTGVAGVVGQGGVPGVVGVGGGAGRGGRDDAGAGLASPAVALALTALLALAAAVAGAALRLFMRRHGWLGP